ncbi:helix-turn-helix transcriptional regulator [Solibaculum mannosilyticum]|uniref:HTH cro/C1-type domain-containing protein n=1 Tax=Solibaculum mannosilyticum TaxID=2780922 RepID=A0A7I8D2Z1_9FIRM|nr:helix-turn-helix domain-containing protein [Solibaculum mannosilyticum]MCO7136501.1 helix-turn-helix domain-containing protein [[Clostridium] leptum]BCI60355.1 hypothetical protein C12CBH8_09940 [Solibaculum mannosilyticum]CZT54984.1 helix-turn-helix protein [Eubacteriaceae bacterium CHKCI005]
MAEIIDDAKRMLCVVEMTDELPALRAKLGLSQEEIADKLGMSRQTYNAIECKKRAMGWNTCLSMVTFFYHNPKTAVMLKNSGHIMELVNEVLT